MVNEIFNGELKRYKLIDDGYKPLRSKSNQKKKKKLDIAERKSDERPDTTDMPHLESEESDAQRRNQSGRRLKSLTPSQMLSRLRISLAQLNAGNNSEKLKNEISQLLYSLCRSKELAKTTLQKFGRHYLKMETIFMNRENSKTNERHRFRLDLTGKLKTCVRYFLSNFYFLPNDSALKAMKSAFYFI